MQFAFWFNLFLANVPILYPLKTRQRFSGVSRSYKMETLAWNGLNSQSVSFGPPSALKLISHSFCFMEIKYFSYKPLWVIYANSWTYRTDVSGEYYLMKFLLISEMNLSLCQTWLMKIFLEIMKYFLEIWKYFCILEIFFSEQKFHLHWKCPFNTQMF